MSVRAYAGGGRQPSAPARSRLRVRSSTRSGYDQQPSSGAPGEAPMFIKSGEEGGPWGGTQRGSIPRLPGWAFTRGGQSQGNIATHVEGHAAAIMWQRRFSSATLLVDRPMCGICGKLLPTCIPPRSRLLVASEEEGETSVTASHYS